MSLNCSLLRNSQERGLEEEREDWSLNSITLECLLLGSKALSAETDLFCFHLTLLVGFVLTDTDPYTKLLSKECKDFLSSETYFYKLMLDIKLSQIYTEPITCGITFMDGNLAIYA